MLSSQPEVIYPELVMPPTVERFGVKVWSNGVAMDGDIYRPKDLDSRRPAPAVVLLGSIEFAAEEFGTRLVVVLGHSNCGAILGTLEQLRRPRPPLSPHTRFIADRIRPAVEDFLAPGLGYDRKTLVAKSVRANVRQSVAQLRTGSNILGRLIQSDQMLVVGAEYSLETGHVEFLDE